MLRHLYALLWLCLTTGGLSVGGETGAIAMSEGYGEWNWEWWNQNYDDADAGTDDAFDRMAGDFNDVSYEQQSVATW